MPFSMGASDGVATAFSVDVWHHAVAVTDTTNTEVILYLDGVEVDRDSYTGALINRDGPLYVGGNLDGNGVYFPGDLDDLRIYDRALSAEEVQRLYELGN